MPKLVMLARILMGEEEVAEEIKQERGRQV